MEWFSRKKNLIHKFICPGLSSGFVLLTSFQIVSVHNPSFYRKSPEIQNTGMVD